MWHRGQPIGDWGRLRALHYGDGVFRTLRVHRGRALDLQGQLDHLLADAARLNLDAEDVELLSAEVRQLAQLIEEGSLKLMLSRCASGRGYAPGSRRSERLMFGDRLGDGWAEPAEQGVTLRLSPVTCSAQPLLAGVKHLNRLDQVLASAALGTDEPEALMCDDRGDLIGGIRSNLFVLQAGRWATPSLHRCGVAGRTRARVLEWMASSGTSVEVRSLRPSDLLSAEACFLTSSILGVWPLRQFEAQRWAEIPPQVRALQRWLCADLPGFTGLPPS